MFVMPGGTQTGYKIPNSLRFNAANTTYLSRTPTVAGNTTTWTWSGGAVTMDGVTGPEQAEPDNVPLKKPTTGTDPLKLPELVRATN